jgi:hypothetical protein
MKKNVISSQVSPLEEGRVVGEGPVALVESELPVSYSLSKPVRSVVTPRAILLGLILSCALAALNCWVATVYNVHFLGGVQMPFGAIIVLLLLLAMINLPLRTTAKQVPFAFKAMPLSNAELLTIYVMLLFAALISTPGTHTFFVITGPTLFYFSTPENRWADLFYQHVPSWFAPGWDGHTYQRDVIEPLFLGGLSVGQIPWHAWVMMLLAWSIFLLLSYSIMFFTSLILRRQWIEHESLAFPLVQLPLQMVDADDTITGSSFWKNRAMWAGFTFAFAAYLLKGLNAHYPDWPKPLLQEPVVITFTERPWSAMGNLNAELHLVTLAVAYLLTSEVAFSLWFFALFVKAELVGAEMLGFAGIGLVKDTNQGQPAFIMFQSLGGWIAVGLITLWTIRHALARMIREAVGTNRIAEGDPFSPRFMLGGFFISLTGLVTWSMYAGINFVLALAFILIYLMAGIVLARIVIESGYLYSQTTFSPIEWITTGMLGTVSLGASEIVKISFLQSVLIKDTRTHLLPSFLHAMKIAHELRFDRISLRRMLGAVLLTILLVHTITVCVSIATLYSNGGLQGYLYYTAAQNVLKGAATMTTAQPASNLGNVMWLGSGAAIVFLITAARSHFVWFPLHHAGLLIVLGYGLRRVWFSCFLGWLIKRLLLRFGGRDAYINARPFMMGLILGTVNAMALWMIVGFFTGIQIPFWPA